ncbi:MAG: prephenate dehydrogenase [Candidatus Acididesulfobacter diazotrophicus]|jgi:prephenate dehydrogenase|uniref:Prephenate dehydrogenase n=1 Tax=Candidatus Acididesulfobacter diazotrophicus TaxID=2597226 RepID=A0A519BPN5_9DELT|nr:MAG: prephenate dehydrogenase [Candidatus Acididesulfobacter diazotrophicus]
MFKEITIIGLGFMGASLAGALKSKKPDIIINGFDINQKNIDFCLDNKFINKGIKINCGYYSNNSENKLADNSSISFNIGININDDINISRNRLNKNINNFDLNYLPAGYNPLKSDIAILCIPPKVILKFLYDNKNKNFLAKFSLITDIGSIKKEIISASKKNNLKNFIGSHPMCGSDKSGAENADINMFQGKTCIVINKKCNDTTINRINSKDNLNNLNKTDCNCADNSVNYEKITSNNYSNDLTDSEKIAPNDYDNNSGNYYSGNSADIEKISSFWKILGMEVIYADADFHDYIVGYSSHLPHIVSFCLSKTVLNIVTANANLPLNSLKYISSGFKDTTRIASSSENIWADIFLLNKSNLISSLDNYIDNLNKFKVLLENNDEDALKLLIAEISKQRKMLG